MLEQSISHFPERCAGEEEVAKSNSLHFKAFCFADFFITFFAVHSSLTLEILFKMFLFSFLHHLMFCYRKINFSWAKPGFAGCAGHFAALGTRWESNANVAFYPVCLCFLQGLMYEAANWQQTLSFRWFRAAASIPCLLWRHFVQKETWESQGGLVGPCGSIPDPVGVSPVPSLPWQWSVHLCACTFPLAPPALWLPSLAVPFLQAASVGTCARVWKTISTMISQVSLNIRIKITLMLKSKLKSICLNRHK